MRIFIFVQIGGILADMGDDVLLDERDRHRPCRVEVDGRDARLDDRRGPVHLADDRDIAAGDFSALDRLDGGGGNVDHDVAVAEGEGRACKPLRGCGELAMAGECRDVDRLQRSCTHGAGFRQAVPGLKPFDGAGELPHRRACSRRHPRRGRPPARGVAEAGPRADLCRPPSGPCRPAGRAILRLRRGACRSRPPAWC